MDRLQAKVVFRLGRESDDGVGTPRKRGKRERGRNAVPLWVDRRAVVARHEAKSYRRRDRGYCEAAAQNAERNFMHASHL